MYTCVYTYGHYAKKKGVLFEIHSGNNLRFKVLCESYAMLFCIQDGFAIGFISTFINFLITEHFTSRALVESAMRHTLLSYDTFRESRHGIFEGKKNVSR